MIRAWMRQAPAGEGIAIKNARASMMELRTPVGPLHTFQLTTVKRSSTG